MTPDRNDQLPDEHDEHGILSDAASIDTTSIGILGSPIAHVEVALPQAADDDDHDDDVIDDGVEYDPFSAQDVPSFDGATPAVTPDDTAVAELEPIAEVSDAGDDADVLTAEVVLDDELIASGADLVADHTPEDSVSASDEHVDADVIENEATDVADELRTRIDEPVELAAAEAADADLEDAVAVASAGGIEPAAASETDAVAEVDGASSDGEAGQDAAPGAPEDAAGSMQAATSDDAAPADRVDAEGEQSVTEQKDAREQAAGAVAPATSSIPTTRREAHHTGNVDRVHEVERVHPPRQEVALTSKRIGEFEPDRESPDLLTADRLLDHGRISGPEPEGRWQHFVYTISGKRINLGDGKRAKARKELDRRIAVPLAGGARFVPVLSRKGGVGKTTITTLLGMALADARDDRIIAIDANPDRGTLAERIASPSGKTVRDLVRMRDEISGYNDVSTIVARDDTRLDVLASDADPRVSEAFSDRDYEDVASLAAHYYSIVLTDTGTGIVHSVMGATLGLADQIVVVAGLSVDEARLASETLTWLETNGFEEQVRGAVVVLNTARPGTPLVRASELEAHFRSRVRAVVRMPYDPQIATGSAISYAHLQPATREAARSLAASVVEGLRGLASAA